MQDCLEANFSKMLGNFHLDVSLHLGEEIGVLFGPSGAGKSQTLNVLAGLVKPDRGKINLRRRILYDSASSTFLKPAARKIGLVFQELALFPHLSAIENVAYGLKGPNKWRLAKKWLDKMRLEGLYERMPHQLSGGQKQRVALARALAPKPDLLLLDEPFSALEGPMRRALRRELKNLFLEIRIPILYVTHDVEDVCSLATKVFLIRDGSITAAIDANKLWDPQCQENVWHSLGWGTLVQGEIITEEGNHWLSWPGGKLKLLQPTGPAKGKVTVFIPPDHVKLLYPDLPVDPELRPNVMEGKIIERIEMNHLVRLYIHSAGIEWHTEHPKDSYSTLNLHEGQNVSFSIKPSMIYVLTQECDPPR